MTTNVHLTAELEQFARSCVASGRYNNVSEVLREGLRLLQAREEKFAAFNKMLREAEAEADRDGWLTLDDVLDDLDKAISEETCENAQS
jgi:antitoxin ParD1/3/4